MTNKCSNWRFSAWEAYPTCLSSKLCEFIFLFELRPQKQLAQIPHRSIYQNIHGTIPAKHMQVAQVITLQLSPSHSSTGIDSCLAWNWKNYLIGLDSIVYIGSVIVSVTVATVTSFCVLKKAKAIHIHANIRKFYSFSHFWYFPTWIASTSFSKSRQSPFLSG